MEDSSRTFEIIYSAVNSAENSLPVSRMCEIAGVSRSGYYAWIKAAPVREKQELQDRKDFELILAAYRQRGYSKGARGIYMSLLHMNPPVTMNLKKIRRIMAKYNLSCPIRKANPYRRIAKALKTSNVAENLLQRQFEDFGPRIVLLTDITYLPYNETFAYRSTILDAYTKQILAYVITVPRFKLILFWRRLKTSFVNMVYLFIRKQFCIVIKVTTIPAISSLTFFVTKNCANPYRAKETVGIMHLRKVSSVT